MAKRSGIPFNPKRTSFDKRRGSVRRLQERFDDRYEVKGEVLANTEGYLVPIVQQTNLGKDISNELIVTIGDRRSYLPNSTPISNIGSHVRPDGVGEYELGGFNRIWSAFFTKRFVLRKTITGPQMSYTYETWLQLIAQKLPSALLQLEGYGAHAVHSGASSGTIKIARPVFKDPSGNQFTWSSKDELSYTQFYQWCFKGFYSPTGIDSYGSGIIRDCMDDASPMSPGVEYEVEDTASDNYVFVRFRNFLPNIVTVGVRVIA